MKAPIALFPMLTATALLASLSTTEARDYGVSAQRYGRGTKYTTERGGTAYVGPRGVAGETAAGTRYAAGARGAAVVGENRAAVTGRYGAVVTGPGGTAVATRTVYPAPLPAGYIRVVPAGYRRVVYGGYNCYYVGGVYYRPVIYQGTTVYVIVR